MFHMSNDSPLFRTARDLAEGGYTRTDDIWMRASAGNSEIYLPLLEAKMLHHFDHRWGTYDGLEERHVDPNEKSDSRFESSPRYWVPQQEVDSRLSGKDWDRGWLLGWRDIVGSEGRTLIPCLCPRTGVGDKFLLVLPVERAELVAALYACLASLACDYFAKQKVGGSSLKYFSFKQLPVLNTSSFSEDDLKFIASRVLELSYTSNRLRPFALDLGYDGPPFGWNEERRALLRAELDAWYARAYGLTRDELRYILDPADVMGEDYPSETFRVLKNNEMKKFGEYRTRRLVLEAWDWMKAGDLK
jgi:hypothetical protein